MVPTITPDCDDSVLPGFERIAKTCDNVCEDCLVRDLTESPPIQALVDDEGGEHRTGFMQRLCDAELIGGGFLIVEDDA